MGNKSNTQVATQTMNEEILAKAQAQVDKIEKTLICKMRTPIIRSHNAGNPKAINKELMVGANISTDVLTAWTKAVSVLQARVKEYVNIKFDYSTNRNNEGNIQAAYERIFPAWKNILKGAEVTLRVSPRDIESLIGYDEAFLHSEVVGTQHCHATATMFRKNVETLIGCKIAANNVMTDDDRDTLSSYYSLQKSVGTWTDRITTLEDEIKSLENQLNDMIELLKKSEMSDDIIAKVTESLNNSIATATADKDSAVKSKNDATEKLGKIADKALAIHKKCKKAEEDVIFE